MEKKVLFILLVLGVSFLQSCDEEELQNFDISATAIDVSDYSGENVSLLYSTDNGNTFSPQLPVDMKTGEVLLVKVNDGEQDLTKEDYEFDWSGSTPAPTSATSDLATFVVQDNISIKLKLKDVLVLVTSIRTTGAFYSLNTVSGVRVELFTPTINGTPLTDVSAFLHHPREKKYYASVAGTGILYSIDPATKAATVINENNGAGGQAVWNDVSSWLVAPDDSLISVGDFGTDGIGIVKFGVNGGRGKLTRPINVCCGPALTWASTNDQIMVSNGNNSQPGQVQFDVYTVDGKIKTRQAIFNFANFPGALSANQLQINSMAKDDANRLFAILSDLSTGASYLVRVYTLSGRINFIATLSPNNTVEYSTLAFVPRHLF